MTIDRYVLFDGCLIGAVGYLTWLAWQLRSQMRSLRTLGDDRGWEALLYIDLDGLKPLNASLGHQGADKVIRSAALAIRPSSTEDLERAAELEMVNPDRAARHTLVA
jgi:hypothetical protein